MSAGGSQFVLPYRPVGIASPGPGKAPLDATSGGHEDVTSQMAELRVKIAAESDCPKIRSGPRGLSCATMSDETPSGHGKLDGAVSYRSLFFC